MKTRLVTHCVLWLTLLAAERNIGLAQNEPPPSAVPAKQTLSPASTAPTTPPPDNNRPTSSAAVFTPTPKLSPWATEMVKLARAGIEDRVMLSFIETAGRFNLGADQIVHLSEVGVSSDVIAAMLQHDYDLASGTRPLTTVTTPPLDPAIEQLLVGRRATPGKVSVPPPAPPATTSTPSNPTEVTVTAHSIPVTVVANRPSVSQNAGRINNANTGQSFAPSSTKPAGPYRVPETCAVELAPPIIVFNGASPTPNLVVIDLFPSSR